MEVKSNELRIGNLVLFQGVVSTINGISKDSVSLENEESICIATDDIQPIQLTKEWLLRFGLNTESAFGPRIDGLEIYGDESGYILSKDNVYGTNIWDQSNSFRYVHQLQNIYFAIVGEEIEIEEKKSIPQP